MDQVPKGPVVGNPNTPQDESVVLVVHKHLFGLVVLYFQVAVGLAAAILLIVFLLPTLVGHDKTRVYAWESLAIMFLLIVVGAILIIATIVYRRSMLVLTASNITQVNQVGLFNRKISQLSLADVEDVSAEQKGVFPTMLRFGTVYIETAGEQANFHFDYCPDANKVAKEVSVCEQAFNKAGYPNQNP